MMVLVVDNKDGWLSSRCRQKLVKTIIKHAVLPFTPDATPRSKTNILMPFQSFCRRFEHVHRVGMFILLFKARAFRLFVGENTPLALLLTYYQTQSSKESPIFLLDRMLLCFNLHTHVHRFKSAILILISDLFIALCNVCSAVFLCCMSPKYLFNQFLYFMGSALLMLR